MAFKEMMMMKNCDNCDGSKHCNCTYDHNVGVRMDIKNPEDNNQNHDKDDDSLDRSLFFVENKSLTIFVIY